MVNIVSRQEVGVGGRGGGVHQAVGWAEGFTQQWFPSANRKDGLQFYTHKDYGTSNKNKYNIWLSGFIEHKVVLSY